MNKNIISTVLFLSLATATYTPVAKCASPEAPFRKIAKIATYSTLGTAATANGVLLGIVSIKLAEILWLQAYRNRNYRVNSRLRCPYDRLLSPLTRRILIRLILTMPLILGFVSLGSLYTSYRIFKKMHIIQ